MHITPVFVLIVLTALVAADKDCQITHLSTSTTVSNCPTLDARAAIKTKEGMDSVGWSHRRPSHPSNQIRTPSAGIEAQRQTPFPHAADILHLPVEVKQMLVPGDKIWSYLGSLTTDKGIVSLASVGAINAGVRSSMLRWASTVQSLNLSTTTPNPEYYSGLPTQALPVYKSMFSMEVSPLRADDAIATGTSKASAARQTDMVVAGVVAVAAGIAGGLIA